jgi:hypothetical protein
MDALLQMTVEQLLNDSNLAPDEIVIQLRQIADEIAADLAAGAYDEK